MPRKNLTEQYQCNISPAQDEAISQFRDVEKSQLIRNLLRKYVESNGGQWPEAPGRGKYKRRKGK